MIVPHRIGFTVHAVDTGSPDVSLCWKALRGGSRMPSLTPYTCAGCREALTKPRLAFCEFVTAGPQSPIHLRVLSGAGYFPSGGADTMSLCGHQVAWDIPGIVNEATLADPRTCRRCVSLCFETRQLR